MRREQAPPHRRRRALGTRCLGRGGRAAQAEHPTLKGCRGREWARCDAGSGGGGTEEEARAGGQGHVQEGVQAREGARDRLLRARDRHRLAQGRQPAAARGGGLSANVCAKAAHLPAHLLVGGRPDEPAARARAEGARGEAPRRLEDVLRPAGGARRRQGAEGA
eukprot:2161159-Prymnesium_polylepis.1